MATVLRDIYPGLLRPTNDNSDAACSWPQMTAVGNDGHIFALHFDSSTEEHAICRVTLKSWDGGSIYVKGLAWSSGGGAASAGVRWSVKAKYIEDNEAIDTAYGTAVAVTDNLDGTPNLNREMIAADFGAITAAGAAAGQGALYLDVARIVSHGDDTMAADARLHGFLLEYTTT